MMRYGWGAGILGGWLAWALMGLMIVLLLVLLIVVMVRLIRHSGRSGQYSAPVGAARPADEENSVLRILDERFAKGEIDEEEYTKRKEMILKR